MWKRIEKFRGGQKDGCCLGGCKWWVMLLRVGAGSRLCAWEWEWDGVQEKRDKVERAGCHGKGGGPAKNQLLFSCTPQVGLQASEASSHILGTNPSSSQVLRASHGWRIRGVALCLLECKKRGKVNPSFLTHLSPRAFSQ